MNQIRCADCVANAIKIKQQKESQSKVAGKSATFESKPMKASMLNASQK